MLRFGKQTSLGSETAIKSRIFGLLYCFLTLWIPPLLKAAPSESHSPLKTYRLANGLDVIFFESHKVPLTTIVLTVKAGAFTETPATNGLTHLWEHMFFKGNAKLPNQEAFNRRIRQLGIVFNGDTSAEKVRYYFTLPSIYTQQGISFMMDAISSPLLERKELEREINVVLDEYDRNASQASFDLSRARQRVIYGKQHYLRDPLGERQTIQDATREQLLKMKDDVFVPKNSALLVSGDINPTETLRWINKYFSNWQNPKNWQSPKPNEFPNFPASTEIIATHKQARTPVISMTFNGPKARQDPKDTYAADILIGLLQLRSGQFYKDYVESGLSYYAYLGYYTQSQAGEVNLSGSASPENFLKLKERLRNEPKNWLKKDYFKASQLEDVKRSLAISHQYEINKPSEYIKTAAFWWAVTGLDYYNSYEKNLKAIDFDDIRAFIRKYLIDKPHVTSILLSPEDATKLNLKPNIKQILTPGKDNTQEKRG